jgi:hypothetical protein
MTTIRRFQLFEFCDQAWIPNVIREVGMGYLAVAARVTKIYLPTAEILADLLEATLEKRIVVLGAGSGGGVLDVVPSLPAGTSVVLTDLFPCHSFESPYSNVTYYPEPVDALSVPDDLNGIRVMYTAFHHFSPESAKKILANVVESRQPVAIFEATERSLKGLLIAFLVPFLILLLIPLVRPFRWSGLLLTYIVPIIPLLGFWDGLISSLRTYNSEDFHALVSDFKDYSWSFRLLKGPRGENVTAMTGMASSP